MGLLRRPATSKIVEDGRLSRPYGLGALRAQSEKTNLRLRRHSHISSRRTALPNGSANRLWLECADRCSETLLVAIGVLQPKLVVVGLAPGEPPCLDGPTETNEGL